MSDLKVVQLPRTQNQKENWGNDNVKNASNDVDWTKSIVVGEDAEGNGHIWIYDFDDHAFLARALIHLQKNISLLLTGEEV